MPNYFGIEVTRRCNLRCPHCFTESGGRAHAGPSTEALQALLGDVARVGGRVVAFSGGEPLLRKDLETAMRYGLEAGIESYTLVTNGFYVEPKRVASLRSAGLKAVQVSVDGVDAAGHCSVRACSPVDFYRALRAIRLFRDGGLVVDVATILQRVNVVRAAEMVLLCEALSVRSLRYCSFVPTGRAKDAEVSRAFAVAPDQLDQFLEFFRGINADPRAPVGMVIDHGIGPWDNRGRFRCEAGLSVGYISAEGDLYPCPGTIFERFRVGNVFQTPLRNLLGSEAMGYVRAISKDSLAGPCAQCRNQACSGGCRGAAYAVTGFETGAPAYCNVLRRQGVSPATP